MHIVILDGGSTNPGDVSWAPLRALGSVTVYDSTKPEEIVERAKDAEAVILNRNVISREIMQKLPKLRFIGLLATGYNTVDVKAAGELGITVCNVPLYCVETVAQQAFALLLELCNHTEKISAATRGGDWDKARTMSHSTHPLFELYGKTLGIVGFGRIGQHLGVMAKAIGMKVIAFDIFHIPGIEEQLGIPYVEMDELLAQSDFVSVHAPAVDGGALISAENIAKMKDGVVIINTSRGTNVDEAALLAALESGKVRAAGLDVYADEPATNKALYSHPMVSCTPHIGAATVEAQKRIGSEIVDIIKNF